MTFQSLTSGSCWYFFCSKIVNNENKCRYCNEHVFQYGRKVL